MYITYIKLTKLMIFIQLCQKRTHKNVKKIFIVCKNVEKQRGVFANVRVR